MAVTVPEMLKMSQTQLDELFTQSPVGEIPSGEAKGTAIVAPGTTYTQDIANFINHFAWQGKIFDPFEQGDSSTRREFGGTGLGLSIVKTFAQLIGATVDVESEVGVGTTFTVHLPQPGSSDEEVVSGALRGADAVPSV